MSEFNKAAQPVRTPGDTENLMQSRIADGVDGTILATVDSDKNLHTEGHGNDPAGVDRALILTEEGRSTARGDYDGTTNTKPSSNALVAHVRNASHTEAQQTMRPTAVQDSGGTKHCLDVSLHDESGAPFSSSNPIPIQLAQNEGTEVHDFSEQSDSASNTEYNHDYSVLPSTTFLLKGVQGSAGGKLMLTVKIGDGVTPTEGFTTIYKARNSVSNPDINILHLEDTPYPVVAGAGVTRTVRVIRKNLEVSPGQTYDLNTTVIGLIQT